MVPASSRQMDSSGGGRDLDAGVRDAGGALPVAKTQGEPSLLELLVYLCQRLAFCFRDKCIDEAQAEDSRQPVEQEGPGQADGADEVEEGEADKEVASPVEAVAEGEGSASDRHGIDLAEDKPGHWSKSKGEGAHKDHHADQRGPVLQGVLGGRRGRRGGGA